MIPTKILVKFYTNKIITKLHGNTKKQKNKNSKFRKEWSGVRHCHAYLNPSICGSAVGEAVGQSQGWPGLHEEIEASLGHRVRLYQLINKRTSGRLHSTHSCHQDSQHWHSSCTDAHQRGNKNTVDMLHTKMPNLLFPPKKSKEIQWR